MSWLKKIPNLGSLPQSLSRRTNYATWKQWPPHIVSASPATALEMWLWPVRDCDCTSHRCWKQHWGGFIWPDKDAKPPRAVFWDESPLTFSTDKKESQTKYAYKHSHSCILPLYSRPDSLGEMIQCDACDAWFHFQCAHVKKAPDSDWFCSK